MRQLFEYHPTIAYRFIPGLKVRVEHESGGYLIRTNSTGFRCEREFARAKTPGTRRVLVFGDSFTAGDGVSNPKRYTDVLETLVPNVEVYNFGLSGTGTDQQYLIWKEFAREIEADALVMTVCAENIRRVNSRYRPFFDDKGEEKVYAKPYFVLENGSLSLHGTPVSREPLSKEQIEHEEGVAKTGRFAFLRATVNKLGLRDIAQKVTGYQPLPEYDDPNTPDWQLMRAVLTQWIGEVSLPVILMPWPVLQYVEETASSENCRARYRELEAEIKGSRDTSKGALTLHDMLPDLWKYSAADRRAMRFPGADIHPTPSGHEAVAKSLAPVLERVLDGR